MALRTSLSSDAARAGATKTSAAHAHAHNSATVIKRATIKRTARATSLLLLIINLFILCLSGVRFDAARAEQVALIEKPCDDAERGRDERGVQMIAPTEHERREQTQASHETPQTLYAEQLVSVHTRHRLNRRAR